MNTRHHEKLTPGASNWGGTLPDNKNPGAAGTATGAKHDDATPKRSRSVMSAYAKPGYKRVARMVGYSLLIGDGDTWHGLTLALTAHLNPQERAALAWASLRSLTPEQVAAVSEAVVPQGAGRPIAPLRNHMDEAAFWADMAGPEELEAYCLASFNAMPRGRQGAFLEYVHGRVAA